MSSPATGLSVYRKLMDGWMHGFVINYKTLAIYKKFTKAMSK